MSTFALILASKQKTRHAGDHQNKLDRNLYLTVRLLKSIHHRALYVQSGIRVAVVSIVHNIELN